MAEDNDHESPSSNLLFSDALARTAAETDYTSAVGKVAISWSYCEAIVDNACIKLTPMHFTQGHCFTSQIVGINRKFDCYLSLLSIKKLDENITKRLNKLIMKSHGLGEKRNRIVHDLWNLNENMEPRRFQISARKTLVMKEISTTVAEILIVDKEIWDYSVDLLKLTLEIGDAFYALPRIQQK